MKNKKGLIALLCGVLMFSVSAENAQIDTTAAQAFQEEFDAKYFEINEGFEKVRHILLHLVKTTGKMATYCEAHEHGKRDLSPKQLIDEVIPDLLIHALQLANYYEVELADKYAERVQFITERANATKSQRLQKHIDRLE